MAPRNKNGGRPSRVCKGAQLDAFLSFTAVARLVQSVGASRGTRALRGTWQVRFPSVQPIPSQNNRASHAQVQPHQINWLNREHRIKFSNGQPAKTRGNCPHSPF